MIVQGTNLRTPPYYILNKTDRVDHTLYNTVKP